MTVAIRHYSVENAVTTHSPCPQARLLPMDGIYNARGGVNSLHGHSRVRGFNETAGGNADIMNKSRKWNTAWAHLGESNRSRVVAEAAAAEHHVVLANQAVVVAAAAAAEEMGHVDIRWPHTAIDKERRPQYGDAPSPAASAVRPRVGEKEVRHPR